MNIIQMSKKELLALRPEDVSRRLTAEEVIHMATALGAFWTYDYDAAGKGRTGMHALLKSGLHSDGFFVSRILLEHENIRRIMANQIVMLLQMCLGVPRLDYVAGIPDGATKLGETVAEMLGVPVARMEKIDGRIVLATEMPMRANLLLVEDFCTRGTGFTEAVLEVRKKSPYANVAPYDPVIVNRGGLKNVSVRMNGDFMILPVVERRIRDWDPAVHCPLCDMGSEAIKPKITDENWQLLTESQLARASPE